MYIIIDILYLVNATHVAIGYSTVNLINMHVFINVYGTVGR